MRELDIWENRGLIVSILVFSFLGNEPTRKKSKKKKQNTASKRQRPCNLQVRISKYLMNFVFKINKYYIFKYNFNFYP